MNEGYLNFFIASPFCSVSSLPDFSRSGWSRLVGDGQGVSAESWEGKSLLPVS
jgi:hypothetical protein